MTIKQSYEAWRLSPASAYLSRLTNDDFCQIVLSACPDTEIEEFFDFSFSREILVASEEGRDRKARAASTLVRLLQWHADRHGVEKPVFTFADLVTGSLPKGKEEMLLKGTDDEDSDTVSSDDEKKKSDGNTAERSSSAGKQSKSRRNRNASRRSCMKSNIRVANRAIAQIDPATLKVVKVWPSMHAASQELGAKNLSRAIGQLRKSSGFYWSDLEDADAFEERLSRKIRGISDSVEEPLMPAPMADVSRSILSSVSDADLITELQRRLCR